jgi:hypothetical protein
MWSMALNPIRSVAFTLLRRTIYVDIPRSGDASFAISIQKQWIARGSAMSELEERIAARHPYPGFKGAFSFSLLGVTISLALLTLAAARAETIDVYDNHGGRVADYDARWAAFGSQSVSVRIVGPCQSSCTVLLGHIPRSRICVTPSASFGFHLAHVPAATATLWTAYPADIKVWINQHGGLQRDLIWMRAPDIYRFFRQC